MRRLPGGGTYGWNLPTPTLAEFELAETRRTGPGRPTPDAIDRMGEVMDDWLPRLELRDQRVVMDWAFEIPIYATSARYKRSEATIRRWRIATFRWLAITLNTEKIPIVEAKI